MVSPSLTSSCEICPRICGLAITSLVVTMPVRTSAGGPIRVYAYAPAPAAAARITRTSSRLRMSVFSNRCIKHVFEPCQHGYTCEVLLRDLPARARWYILFVIGLGAVTFCALVPRATFTPIVPLFFLVLLSSLTSAFKVRFGSAGAQTGAVRSVVASPPLPPRAPPAGMIAAAAPGGSQPTLNSRPPTPPFRTLFNMSMLILTAQAAGQV